MIPQVISHYRIVRPLGAGGMGEVYLAEDTRLGRQVALKVLPEEFTRHADRLRRFEQEARAASALNHPNIVTIHDVGQIGDTRFIVTEFIDGETLRHRITTSRPSMQDALDIAIQVADALAAAHRVGIVHRDIKPENVMLRADGYAKVLDFGLAKLAGETAQPAVSEAPTVARTEPGAVMGTVSYMSPEQARGNEVDASSDVFSLGVVLYEILTGQLPFRGATATDVIVAILHAEPPSISGIAPAVPPELEAAVVRALAKDKSARHGSAGEFAEELKRIRLQLRTGGVSQDVTPRKPGAQASLASQTDSGRSPSRPRRRGVLVAGALALLAAAGVTGVLVVTRPRSGTIDTLAVLPFENASAGEDAEYLSDGITESLINSLSQMPNLKVMSRSAVWKFKATGARGRPDLGDVARELNVRAILTGRIARRGDRLTISAELIDARDNTQIWGEQYDRPVAEVLALQEELANSILDRLRLKFSGDDRRVLATRHTDDTEAYESYLRGRYHLNRRSADAIRKGRDFFQQAIEKDPAYALAYSGISDSYALLAAQGAIAHSEAYAAAVSAARKAVELDPQLGEGHASLAHALFHSGQMAEAEREFARAVALKPDYLPAYHWQSEYLDSTGRKDEAFAMARKALEIDPLDLAANAWLATLLVGEQRYDEATTRLRKTLEIDPNYFLAHNQLGNIYLTEKRYADAIAEFEESTRLTGGTRGPQGLAKAYVITGRRDDARRVLAELEERARVSYVDPFDLALVAAALEDKEATLRWLTKARAGDDERVGGLRKSEDFEFLRDDPRFTALVGEP